jgi:iron(III) transport system substrate-binding protein
MRAMMFATAAFCAFLPISAIAADDTMIAAAKKEGQVVWYTTQIINQLAQPAADAFAKKYGVKVSPIRSDTSEIVLRITNEARAGRMQADIFDGTATVPALKRAGLVAQWQPEAAKTWPKHLVDAEGFWIATNIYVHTPIFNTQLLPRGKEPHVWDDLLNPALKDKIAISGLVSSSSGPGFVGTVFSGLGEERGLAFLKQLSGQKIHNVNSASRSVVDQAIAGEYALVLQAFNHHAVISAAQGAPVDWIKWSPAMSVLSIAALTKDAPHPNAAKLFAEFLTSAEGQRLFAAADYIPADPAVPAKVADLKPDAGGFQAITLTPEELDRSIGKWADIYKDIFR